MQGLGKFLLLARVLTLGLPNRKLDVVSYLVSSEAWVNYEFNKARRSQAVWFLAPIFKLSVFGKRVTQSGLCPSTETRLRKKQTKNSTRECGGWVNFDKWPEWKRSGSHRNLSLVSHLISVRIWVNMEFVKGRRSKTVRCLFLMFLRADDASVGALSGDGNSVEIKQTINVPDPTLAVAG